MYSSARQRELFDLSKQYLALPATAEEYALLVDILVYQEWRYYILNDPVLSDYEYDQLYQQVVAIEAVHPELTSADSPTQRVSSDLTEDFQRVAHLTPMLSLDNSYNAEDLRDFDQSLKRLLFVDEEADISYAVEPKYDGGSIAVVYENDRLVRAATRGNGTIGDEITANARVIRSLPLRAAFSQLGMYRVELRGEVIIRKDRFLEINAARQEADLTLFANPRNTATGGLRMKDPREVASRELEAFIYTFGFAEDEQGKDMLDTLPTHTASLDELAKLGFKIPVAGDQRKACKNIDEVIAFCRFWEERREGYAYEIDGMVVKVDDRTLQERAGYTSHHPRWAIAYKFAAKQGTSRLLKVDYQVGKIGTITPVAKIAPVALAGVTITSISLHNEDFIQEKDLRLGDMVLVERAGDVIPYIVKALTELRDGSEQPIEWPQVCPINDTEMPVPLVRDTGEAAWRCPTCICGAQPLARLIFHVSKPAMDIDGMGKQIVERLYQLGMVRSLADVYRLDYEKIAQLEGFGERSAKNLAAAIEKAKSNPIQRLLHSLTIHHLGKKASQLLAAEVDHVLELADWTEEDFLHIKDIGPTVAKNVQDWFADAANIALLRDMESLGVNMRPTANDAPKAAVTEGPFVGKTILFTGTLQTMSRKEAQEKAEAAGARNVSAISSKLDILVVGEKAGSKLKKAQALGTVEVMTEAEFLEKVTG